MQQIQQRHGISSARPCSSTSCPSHPTSAARAAVAHQAGVLCKIEEFEQLVNNCQSRLRGRAAVFYEMGEYDKVVADCTAAVERGRELRADYKMVARALTRKGNAQVKLGDLPAAIESYHKALTEHRCADICVHRTAVINLRTTVGLRSERGRFWQTRYTRCVSVSVERCTISHRVRPPLGLTGKF